VENGGKLFERLMGDKPVNSNKHYYWEKIPAFPFVSEFLPTPRKPKGQGLPQRRVGFFCYFSYPLRKVK